VSDLFEATLQPFDIIIVALIIVSAVMSLGRGLIREAFSVVAFIIGGLAAILAHRFLGPAVADVVPDTWPPITPTAIVVVIGFLAAYSLAAFIGGRLSKLIHAQPEIGVLDRIAGAAFGVVRGVLAAVLFVLLMQQVLPDNATPTFVSKARSYEYLNIAASWIRDYVPGIVERAGAVLPETPVAQGVAEPN
jgi:membrane protein required for colicin V production